MAPQKLAVSLRTVRVSVIALLSPCPPWSKLEKSASFQRVRFHPPSPHLEKEITGGPQSCGGGAPPGHLSTTAMATLYAQVPHLPWG